MISAALHVHLLISELNLMVCFGLRLRVSCEIGDFCCGGNRNLDGGQIIFPFWTWFFGQT